MMTAKLFENGRSQAVRLPKECQFAGDEVVVNKIGDIVMPMPKNNKWSGFLAALICSRMILWRMEESSQRNRREKIYEVYAGYQYLYLCD